MKNLRFPRLSLGLALVLALSAFAFAAGTHGLLIGFVCLLALLAPSPSHRLGAFENVIDAELGLAKIMDTVLEAFVGEILPLRAFSLAVNPNAQTLNELKTATLVVPYIPLQTANTVKDFDAANGDCYDRGGTSIGKREVVINKRKYLPWGLTSWQAATAPVLGQVDFAAIFGRQLAEQVLADILGLVTAANFPNELVVGAAAGFDTNDVFDIRQELNTLRFPKVGRSLILTPDYDTALLKDNKDTNLYGSTDPRWNARIPRIADMEEYGTPAFDDNTDVDAGIVSFPSALLVAMAPLQPLPSVRGKLVEFEIFTHAESGISLTYKKMADEFCDRELELVECTYGAAVGQEEALLRLEAA